MKIKILGTGCSKCKKLYELTTEIVEEIGLNADIEKVDDLDQIMDYGVMRTPALVINEVVKLAGALPTREQLKFILQTK